MNKNSHIITCHNLPTIDISKHDGGIAHLNGVRNYQITRCCKVDNDFTYNHAPMITSYNNHLILSYISGQKDEHVAPDKIAFKISSDGINWNDMPDLFPFLYADTTPYIGPKKSLMKKIFPTIVHHRMSFYKTTNNTMIACAFYGLSPDLHMAPNNGYGIARLVRRIYDDFSLSPLYILKYNESSNYNMHNTVFYKEGSSTTLSNDGVNYFYDENSLEKINIPFYKNSTDTEFINACDSLLSQRLITEQWYEEEQFDSSHFTTDKAMSFYELPNKNTIGICKKGIGYLFDNKFNILKKENIPTLTTNNAKVWAQKTPSNQYIICFNPTEDSTHRWPLVLMTSNDGINYSDMKTILPEIPPYRYEGKIKNLGAQYMRGICGYNGFFDENVWITYSTNKEDIWVSCIKKNDDFNATIPKLSNISQNNNIWNVKDYDPFQRAIIEYFPKNKSGFVKLSVKKTLPDNPVLLCFYDKHEILKKQISISEGVIIKNYTCYNDININLSEISRITVFSKKNLSLNTINDDGRYGQLKSINDITSLKDINNHHNTINTEFTVEFL